MSAGIAAGARAKELTDEALNERAADSVEAAVPAGESTVTPGGAWMSWPIVCEAAAPDRVPVLAGPSAVAVHGSSKKTNVRVGSDPGDCVGGGVGGMASNGVGDGAADNVRRRRRQR